MTTALVRRGADTRDPAKASGRLRRAAEHYVRSGMKAIGPSLVWAGYSQNTAKDPAANGYTHDWLVAVARYWNKGSQLTARSHLSKAIARLGEMLDDPNAQIRGQAAKTIIDVAGKEEEKDDTVAIAAEEQARWISLIRHWKRTFLRRGILLGLAVAESNVACGPGDYQLKAERCMRLLAELNYVLGKSDDRPEWWGEEEVESEPEGITGPAPTADPNGSEVEAGAPTDEVLSQGLDEDEG